MTTGKPNPGSSKKGDIDLRSSDAQGKQADEVKSHAEKASDKPAEKSPRAGETAGALKDQTGR
ncbi:hypothetical protein [Roseococcus pinisoli]|uniref:CsbD family protein n=1 Tax=Roseococcus pinisoli TaxID=2835040 RepID=A0ABS5Q9B9_9PROT|nr:hypothetical protein [Roseococcus pinisoli]MBS7810299.1 hypothetical protein [Roseococcus pinisoli]